MSFKKKLLDIEKLQTNGFEQHVEILCKLVKKGKTFYEVPTNHNARTIEDGKKIRFYHVFPLLFRIMAERIK